MGAHLEDGQDVGVVQGPRGAGLEFEAGQAVAVLGQLPGEDLDGHVPVDPQIVGTPDLAHPSRAEGRDDLVGADAGARLECHWFPRG
jgi:hypothetical protein